MNNDLISREALKEELKQYFTDGVLDGVSAKVVFNQILHDIDNAPTVTPDKIQAIMSDYLVYRCEPQRPQGKWIDRNGNTWCSVCRNAAVYLDGERPLRTDFCPNCGAKMQKGGAE